MKLLAVRTARAIWLVPRYFLNPKGIDTRPALEGIKARYSFLKSPLESPIPASGELKFEFGSFSGKNGPVQIGSFVLYGDGLVADSRSTTGDSEEFLEDVTTWVSKEFGLPFHTELPIKRVYVSELNVVLHKVPKIFDSEMASFFGEISTVIGDERFGKLDFMGFQLGTDPALSETQKMFRFEREINVPFGENRYYSSAPIRTEAHIKLLEKLDAVT